MRGVVGKKAGGLADARHIHEIIPTRQIITLGFTIYNTERPTWFNVLLNPILLLCLFNFLLHTISTINIITPKGTTVKITSNATRSISQVSITRPKFHRYLPLSFLHIYSYQFSSSLIRPPIQLVQTINGKPVPN